MIRTLTKKKIAELQNLHDMKNTEYNELLETEVIDIWKDDLEKFKKLYEKNLKEYKEEMYNVGDVEISGTKKKTRRGITKRVKKNK